MEKEHGLINTLCSVYICCPTDACAKCMKNTKIKDLVESCTTILFSSESITKGLIKVHF